MLLFLSKLRTKAPINTHFKLLSVNLLLLNSYHFKETGVNKILK